MHMHLHIEHVLFQLAFSYTMSQMLPTICTGRKTVQRLLDAFVGQKRLVAFMIHIIIFLILIHFLCRQKRTPILKYANTFVVGKQDLTKLDQDTLHSVNLTLSKFNSELLKATDLIQKFYRLSINNCLFFSEAYKRIKTRNSYTILYYQSDQPSKIKVGKVLYFLHIHTTALAIIKELEPFHSASTPSFLHSQIVPVKIKDCVCAINISTF